MARRSSAPAGQAGVNVRDVPYAGYKVVGDKMLLTVHIDDKGKPMTVPVIAANVWSIDGSLRSPGLVDCLPIEPGRLHAMVRRYLRARLRTY